MLPVLIDVEHVDGAAMVDRHKPIALHQRWNSQHRSFHMTLSDDVSYPGRKGNVLHGILVCRHIADSRDDAGIAIRFDRELGPYSV